MNRAKIRQEITDKYREGVSDAAEEIAQDIKNGHVDRDQPHDAIFEHTDSLFTNLVQEGRIDQYDTNDMVKTALPCVAIIKIAEEDAWLPYDSGLWEGVTYGILACIAFHALENLIWQKLRDMNVID